MIEHTAYEPRYKNKLRVKDKKNIIRSINTYIKYDSVKYIYISYNGSYYELNIFLESDDEAHNIFDTTNYVLVYFKKSALKRKYNSKVIESILNEHIPSLVSEDEYENIFKYIFSYDTLGINTIFDLTEEEIIFNIQNCLNNDSYYINEYGRKIFYKTVLSKKIFTIVFNKLHHENFFRNKITSISNDFIRAEKSIEEIIDNNISETLFQIDRLTTYNNLDFFFENDDSFPEDINEIEKINLALENIDNSSFSGEYAGWDYESLISERQYLIDTDFDELDLNYNSYINLIKNYHYEFNEINILFEDYIVFYGYLEGKKKSFSKENVEKIINELIEDGNKLYSIKRLRRRKIFLKELIEKYSFDFKHYYKICIENNKKSEFYNKNLLIYRLMKLHENKHKLNEYKTLEEKSFCSIFEEQMNDIYGATYTEIMRELSRRIEKIIDEKNEYYDGYLEETFRCEIDLSGLDEDLEIINFLTENYEYTYALSFENDNLIDTSLYIEYNLSDYIDEINNQNIDDIYDYTNGDYILSLYYSYIDYYPVYINYRTLTKDENIKSDLPIDDIIECFDMYDEENFNENIFRIDYESNSLLDKNFVNYTLELELINKEYNLFEKNQGYLYSCREKLNKFDERINALNKSWIFLDSIRKYKSRIF